MKHCGYVTLLGRPNVGKSTLLNQFLGQKISIISRKPQTTRHQILGIKTTGNEQFIFVDTPGLHQQGKLKLNRYMNQTALRMMVDADVVLFMVEADKWLDADQWVLEKLRTVTVPVLLVINKVDQLSDQRELLPFIDALRLKFEFADIVPIAAKKNDNLDRLQQAIAKYLPASPHFYTKDQITDRSERFLVAEMIREQLMRHLGQELPYATTVMIEQFKREPKIIRISAVIFVNRDSQKAIIIGKQGQVLKKIGSLARANLETLLAQKVFLQLWVKVKHGWSDDERSLKEFGYGE